MTRVFLARSDVSQIKALYSGEEGGRLAEAIRHNCNVWFPLNPGGNGNDA
ncbi:Clp protease (plasmid) [Enterobacter huaxiensis]|nr:Clp protease [Enterobacter huaxiensis]